MATKRTSSKILKNLKILRTRLAFASLLALITLVPLALYMARDASPTQAWWNDVWQYRTRYDFTHNAALTDRRVEVTIDTATLITDGKMESDCKDSRFTDINGALLAHDLTGTCNNASTTYDVLFPTIIDGDHVFYHYYGNPVATDTSTDLSSYTSLSPSGGAPSGASEEVTQGPVAYWAFDEGYGSNAYNQINPQDTLVVSTSGPNSPGTLVNDAAAGATAWSNVTDAVNSNDADAILTALPGPGTPGHYIKTTNYGFSVPDGAVINGIEVGVEKATDDTLGTADYRARIVKGGTIGTTDKSDPGSWSATDAITTYGSSSELWGETWSASDINNSGFGFAFSAGVDGGSSAFVDDIYVTVYYTETLTNTGSISGATWSADQCIFSKCVSFDGVDDVVTVANVNNIDFDKTLASGFTISTWVRINSDGESNVGEIFQKGTNTYCRTTNEASGLVDLECSLDLVTSDATLTIADGLSTNTWHHIALAYTDDADDEITIFIDGQNQGSSTNGDGAPATDANNLLIGGDTAANFHGFIDEVKIYPYARTADQIKSDYAARGGSASSVVLGTKDTTTLSHGLVGYWKLDENVSGNGQSITDSSGNSNSGTTNYGANTTGMDCTISGKYSFGCNFDGADDYIDVGNDASLEVAPPFSISLWTNLDSLAADNYLLGTDTLATNYYGANVAVLTDGSIWVSLGDGTGATSSDRRSFNTSASLITASQWYHIVAVVNSSTDIDVYVDGVLASGSNSGTGGAIAYSANSASLGRYSSTLDADGSLDDVRIYNRAINLDEITDLYALSPQEIQSRRQVGPGPVAYYTFDENTGTSTVFDRSGNGNDGTMNGSMTESDWVRGKFGSALDFDGADDYVNTGLGDHYTQTTITGWIYLDSFGETSKGRIVDKRDAGSEVFVWYVKDDGAESRLQFFRTFSTTGGDWYTPTDSISTGQWNHIALTYDSSSTTNDPQIFINGVAQTVTEGQTPVGTASTNSDPYILGNRTAGDRSFDGKMDDFKIYNYIRTPGQIIQDMNGGHPLGGSPVGSQVAYWSFDNDIGDTAYDSSTQGNNGDLAGTTGTCPGAANCPTYTPNGKIGGAYIFDGAEDRINAGNDTSLQTVSITISAWAKMDVTTSRALVTKGESLGLASERDWDFFCSSSGQLRFVASNGSSYIINATEDGTSCDTSWHYYAVTWDGTTNTDGVVFYRDGLVVGHGTATSNNLSTNEDVYPGGYKADGANEFDGTLDEVKIYAAALTQDEILIDMNANSATSFGTGGTREQDTLTDGAMTDPIAYWDFNENTGTTTVYDKSGNGNDGTLVETPLEDYWVRGKRGSAYQFGTSVAMQVGSSSDYDTGGEHTWMFWLKPQDLTTSTDDQQKIINNGAASGNRTYQISFGDSADGVCGNVSADCLVLDTFRNDGTNRDEYVEVLTSNMSENEWNHVAFTYSVTDSQIRSYLNGSLQYERSIAEGTGFGGTTSTYRIGSDQSESSMFDGVIDEFKIFNVRLSPAQVAYEYNRGAPVGWWQFDECQGATAYDASGNGNDGTITIGATGTNTSLGTCSSESGTEAWNNGTTGKFNASLDFDGTNDYISMPHDASKYHFGTTKFPSYSVAFWLNTTSTENEHIVSKFFTGAADYPFAFHINVSSGKMRFKIYDGSNLPNTDSISDINDGTWHHIVGVRDTGDDQLRLYIDGRLEDQATDTTTSGVSNTSDIYVGRDYIAGGGNWFNGQIDDVRLYNYPLSTTQIQIIMQGGTGGGSAVRFGD